MPSDVQSFFGVRRVACNSYRPPPRPQAHDSAPQQAANNPSKFFSAPGRLPPKADMTSTTPPATTVPSAPSKASKLPSRPPPQAATVVNEDNDISVFDVAANNFDRRTSANASKSLTHEESNVTERGRKKSAGQSYEDTNGCMKGAKQSKSADDFMNDDFIAFSSEGSSTTYGTPVDLDMEDSDGERSKAATRHSESNGDSLSLCSESTYESRDEIRLPLRRHCIIPRRSGYSCEACRRRKVRCDGGVAKKKACNTCLARGERCSFRRTRRANETSRQRRERREISKRRGAGLQSAAKSQETHSAPQRSASASKVHPAYAVGNMTGLPHSTHATQRSASASRVHPAHAAGDTTGLPHSTHATADAASLPQFKIAAGCKTSGNIRRVVMLQSDMTEQAVFDIIFKMAIPDAPRDKLPRELRLYFPGIPEVPYEVGRGDAPAWRAVIRTARRHLERQAAKDGASDEIDVNVSF